MEKNLDVLPYDILFEIIRYLELDDFVNLTAINPVLLEDDLAAKFIAMKYVRFLKKTRSAVSGHTTFRDVVEEIHNTNHAIITAQPYSVAILSFASDFIFYDGILSYVDSVSSDIRILDVRGPDGKEQVVDTRRISSRIDRRRNSDRSVHELGEISLLHYASGMLVFLAGERLVLLDIRPDSTSRVRYSTILTSTRDIFARIDDSNLFYGQCRSDNYGIFWSIQWIGHITTPNLIGKQFRLNEIKGASLGRDVCFEIVDHHLYAISTVPKEETEMDNWRSFYHVACIAPGSRSPGLHTIWRRDHEEKPIDESRTKISISINEATGKPRISESRVEWHEAWSRYVRTYYEEPLPLASLTPVVDDLKNLLVPLRGPTQEDRTRYQRIGKMVRTDCSRLSWAENQYHTYHSCARAFIKLFTPTETGTLCVQTKFCQGDSPMLSLNQEHCCPTQAWPANNDTYSDPLHIPSGRITKTMVDEGSIICLVDTTDSDPQVVLINFDPQIQIPYTGNDNEEPTHEPTYSGRSVRTLPATHLSIRKGKRLR